MRAWDVVWGSITGARGDPEQLRRRLRCRHHIGRLAHQDHRTLLDRLSRAATAAKRSTPGSRSMVVRSPTCDTPSRWTSTTWTAPSAASSTSTASTSRPQGFGKMEITDGVAYGEPFESATAGVRLEGEGARLENIQTTQGRWSWNRGRVRRLERHLLIQLRCALDRCRVTCGREEVAAPDRRADRLYGWRQRDLRLAAV